MFDARIHEFFTYGLGDSVTIKGAKASGLVTGILIEKAGIQYRIAYWVDEKRHVEWVDESEIESA